MQVRPSPLLSFFQCSFKRYRIHFSYCTENFDLDQLANKHILIESSVTVKALQEVSNIESKWEAEKSSVKKKKKTLRYFRPRKVTSHQKSQIKNAAVTIVQNEIATK